MKTPIFTSLVALTLSLAGFVYALSSYKEIQSYKERRNKEIQTYTLCDIVKQTSKEKGYMYLEDNGERYLSLDFKSQNVEIVRLCNPQTGDIRTLVITK